MQEHDQNYKEVLQLFNKYDLKANKAKKRFERVWKFGIFSGVIAVIIFADLTVFRKDFDDTVRGLILPIIEVLLIIYSFIALSKLAPNRIKQFIDARRNAEILRLHQLFSSNGINLKSSLSQGLRHYDVPQDISLLEDKIKVTSSKNKTKENYNKILEELQSFIHGQKKYHSKIRIDKFHKREHKLELSLQIILWLFLLIIGLKLCVELLSYFELKLVSKSILKGFLYAFKFSVIFLPPLYAALEGFYYFSEWKRNIAFSENVNSQYDLLLNQIKQTLGNPIITEDQLKNISDRLNDVFHNDNLNWYNWYMSKKIEPRI